MSNKTKNKSGKQATAKSPRKQINFLPLLAASAVVVCAAVVFLVNGNGTFDASGNTERESAFPVNASEASDASSNTKHESSKAAPIAPGESLVIPTADITSEASFFPVAVDGTNMEVIAVRDSAGNIRTAFNTCQICYDSGRGYYVQSGDYLVCQNCGNRFSMEQVGIESGGCNPWPIFDENKTSSADEISISYDFLVEAQSIFENWKVSY